MFTTEKIVKILKKAKTGRTAPELAEKVGSSLDTTRRAITRLMERGQLEYSEYYKKFSKTGKELTSYVIM